MTHSTRDYKIDPLYAGGMLRSGIVFAAISLLILPIPLTQTVEAIWPVIFLGLLTMPIIGGAVYCFRYYFSAQRYSVHLGKEGLSLGEKKQRFIPFTEIQELSFRKHRKDILLLDNQGKTLARLKLQLSGCSRLIEQIIHHCPQVIKAPQPGKPQVYKGSPAWLFPPLASIIVVILIQVIYWDPLQHQLYMGFTFCLMTLFYIFFLAKREIRRLTIDPTGLTVSYLIGKKSFPIDRIKTVKLFFPSPKTSSKALDILVTVKHHGTLEICPPSQEPIALYWAAHHILTPNQPITLYPQPEE